ncbi:hypothetical protein FM996_02125 [Methylosinus sporium]|uniref:Uncharacterized protein n=1 Tax=Methylosinus sporium TaxID=428 RepID=A0A549T6S6_METSR|nr:hypothetical protein [Methylosinus sporium]TRL37579.1 hypothetical protein FM996_02125 [Methylosinus sporium]
MSDKPTPSPSPDSEPLGFVFDIAMALHPVALYWGRGKRLDLDDKKVLAKRILEHMITAGVVLARRPPLDGHGGPRR